MRRFYGEENVATVKVLIFPSGGRGGQKSPFFVKKGGFGGLHDRGAKTRQDRNPPIYTVFKMPYVRSFPPPPRGTAYSLSTPPPPLPPQAPFSGAIIVPVLIRYIYSFGSVIACTRVRHCIPYIGLYYSPYIDIGENYSRHNYSIRRNI